MKRQLGWAVTSVVALSMGGVGAASAADMAAKAPAYKAPPILMSNWSGFYIGGNVGGGWADSTFSGVPLTGDHFLLPGSSFGTGNGDGNVVGGVQVGFNWQWDRIVLGIEGTYSGADVRNHTGLLPDPVFGGENIQLNSKLTEYATIVGRLGFAPTNDWLLYAKGGYATGDIKTNPQDFFPLPATLQHFSSGSGWHNGWTVGGGVEYKWAQNWVFGVEYDYYQFDSKNQSNAVVGTTGPAVGAPVFYSENVKMNMSTVTARLSYLFNWGGGPVVAKY
jgi:outer membrane immunogenic protein